MSELFRGERNFSQILVGNESWSAVLVRQTGPTDNPDSTQSDTKKNNWMKIANFSDRGRVRGRPGTRDGAAWHGGGHDRRASPQRAAWLVVAVVVEVRLWWSCRVQPSSWPEPFVGKDASQLGWKGCAC